MISVTLGVLVDSLLTALHQFATGDGRPSRLPKSLSVNLLANLWDATGHRTTISESDQDFGGSFSIDIVAPSLLKTVLTVGL